MKTRRGNFGNHASNNIVAFCCC